MVIRSALHDIWTDLFTTAVSNLLWLVAIVLVIPGPPATLALFYVTNRLAHGEVIDVMDFWTGLRRYWGVAWRWGFLNFLLVAILTGDYVLTGRLNNINAARFIQGFYLAILAIWILLQIFALPWLFEQEEPSLKLALRNAAVMLGRNPGFAIGVGLLVAAIMLAGTLLFMLSLAAGGFFLASVGNHAVLNRLEAQAQAA